MSATLAIASSERGSEGEKAAVTAATAMVRAESLRFFMELLSAKGQDPLPFLEAARVDPDVIADKDKLIPYRQMIHLLENGADTLNWPDLGLQLARSQYTQGILGPLDIAMRNSATVGDAWRYCAEHVHLYSTGAHIEIAKSREPDGWIIRFEILLPRLYQKRQAVEHALLISHLATRMFSGDLAAARKVWFSHDPLPTFIGHKDYFGCNVEFAHKSNALLFSKEDFALPIVGRDDLVLELARFYIDAQFPSTDTPLRTRVRIAIEHQLGGGRCTQGDIASALGIHQRTLQRRLKEENDNFEAIKDDARRDAAVRYLRHTKLPLKTIAGLLGYSELSVLYRTCHRWFNASPSTVRDIADISLLEDATKKDRLPPDP